MPVIGRAQDVYGPPPPSKEFKEGCLFLGIAKKGEALVAFYFQQERWTTKGLMIEAVLVPTDKFPFERGYRGFQKKDHYRIKKGRALRLTFDGGMATFSLKQHVDIGDTSPIVVEFVSRKKKMDFISDDVEKMEFDVKDVARWVKVPKKDLPMWSRSFDELESIGGEFGRTAGMKTGATAENRAAAPKIDEAEYQGRYVTLNGTYLFESKTVYSAIIAVLDVGTFLEHTKPVGGGWMEVLYGDSRQKGYVLSVYLVDNEEEAFRWETEKGLTPIEPPLGPTPSEEESKRSVEP